MEFSFPLGEAKQRRPTKMGIADAWPIAMRPSLLKHHMQALAVFVDHQPEVSPGMEQHWLLPLQGRRL